MQFPAQTICSPEHFRYNLVPKTEVPETRTDLFSTFRDPAHCSAHVLAENFILSNSRLHNIFVESKNTQIGVRTKKLWPKCWSCRFSRVVPKFEHAPVFHSAKIYSVTGCSARLRWSQEFIYSVPNHPTITHIIQILPESRRNP